MPLYSYKELSPSGETSTGIINAESIYEARDLLRSQGVMIVDIKADDKSLSKRRLKNKDLINFTLQLSQMIKANIPLYESLLTLEEQHRNDTFHPILLTLCNSIKGGASLSQAMSMFPESFEKLHCSLIAAGESSGVLGESLEKLSELLSRNLKIKQQISSTMLYPAILACFSLIVILSLVTFVIPSIESVFAGKATNGITAIVLSASHFIRDYWMLYLPTTLLFFTFSIKKLRSPSGKKWLDSTLLKIPLARNLIKQTAIARFSRTMATLLKGGVPLIDAMRISQKVMGNGNLENVIARAEKGVNEGNSLSKELKKSKYIPSLVSNMLAVGEESGNLIKMFYSIADMYDSELEKTLGRMTTLSQPIILIVMGLIVGFVLLAVLLPLTDVSSLSTGIHSP